MQAAFGPKPLPVHPRQRRRSNTGADPAAMRSLIMRNQLLRRLFLAVLIFNVVAAMPATASARKGMVAAADARAVDAGLAMLQAGGSAVDAAIATQLVLGLVEPQSSGIGGGAFLMHFDRRSARVQAYDGRETAPAAADERLFLDASGQPLAFHAAAVGGRAVGVPGLMRMAELAHRAHGRLPWATLFSPAIRLAEDGFDLSPRLHLLLGQERFLVRDSTARSLFYLPDGRPKPVGSRIRNPAYADTLRAIAAEGADAMHKGPLADAIVVAVQGHENSGKLTRDDMTRYQAKEREAICRPYRSHRVCVMPPPTSGGVAVLQMLALLEPSDLVRFEPGSADLAHLFLESSRLAFADRDQYLADPDFVPVPVEALLAPDYLAARAKLIDPARSMGVARPGEIARKGARFAPAPDLAIPSTSHLSVVDGQGNAVSMTSSIEDAFGARVMVGGFLLNNQLTDFSFLPARDGRPIANRAEGGKRPRSSMAPVLVFDRAGQLRLVAGSPGGARIINYVAKTLIASLDLGLDPARAAALPNLVNRNGVSEIEDGPGAADLAQALAARGHATLLSPLTSGIHVIKVRQDGTLEGGADPRREGVARPSSP